VQWEPLRFKRPKEEIHFMEVCEKNSGDFIAQIFGKASSNNQASFHHFFAKLKDFQQV